MGPKYNHKDPYERKADIYRRPGSNAAIEPEIEVMWPQLKACWQPLEAGRGKKRIAHLESLEKVLPTF